MLKYISLWHDIVYSLKYVSKNKGNTAQMFDFIACITQTKQKQIYIQYNKCPTEDKEMSQGSF